MQTSHHPRGSGDFQIGNGRRSEELGTAIWHASLFSGQSYGREREEGAGNVGTQTDVDKSAVSYVLAEYPR